MKKTTKLKPIIIYKQNNVKSNKKKTLIFFIARYKISSSKYIIS